MNQTEEFSQQRVDAVRQVLRQASTLLQVAYERISGGCIDMTPGDKRVLTIVAARPDIILREIRELLSMPNSTLTSVVDRLEKRGLVRRTVTARDRRSYGLELTDGGRAYMALQDQAEQDFAIQILRILETDDQREAFVNILSKVISRLA